MNGHWTKHREQWKLTGRRRELPVLLSQPPLGLRHNAKPRRGLDR